MRNQSETKQKIILVTGGCGYLGSQLIRDLIQIKTEEHVTVRILDNMQTGQYYALMNLPEMGNYQFMEGDILDPNVVKLALQGVDTVIHLAAIVRTPMSFDHPAWVEQVNHWGTSHLVEACLDAQVKRFIFASTTAVYGPGGPFHETDPCHPIGAYAQSKYQAEKSIMAATSRGLESTILRFGTIFGFAPVIRFDAVANRFAYLSGIGRSLTVFGTGDQQRPVLHIKDASRAICFCLVRGATVNHVFNVVAQNASILELVEAIHQFRPETGTHFTEQDILTHLSFEVISTKLCDLGWKAEVSIQEGFKELLEKFNQIRTVSSSHYTNMNDL